MMKSLIEKFYHLFFMDETKEEAIPYSHMRLIFWVSLVLSSVVIFLIVKEIIKNIMRLP